MAALFSINASSFLFVDEDILTELSFFLGLDDASDIRVLRDLSDLRDEASDSRDFTVLLNLSDT